MTIIRLIYLGIFLFLSISMSAQSSAPEILKSPEEWFFERLDFPLGYASEILDNGFQEQRFHPDFFNTDTTGYFTYIFAMKFRCEKELDGEEVRLLLRTYYRGLSQSLVEDDGMTADTAKVQANWVSSANARYLTQPYQFEVGFVDYIADDRFIKLNIEIRTAYDVANQQMLLLALISPRQWDTEIWKELRGYLNDIWEN
jgi:hypothetical protein